MKKLLTGLFRSSRKRLMTRDNDMGMFRDKLNELVAQKDTLSDEDIDAKVEELKTICNDLPDDDGKAKLIRFLEDFKAVKEQDQKVAEEAASQVADQFEKLDTAAMQDVPGATDEAPEETTEEETLVEGSAPEAKDADGAEEVTTEEIAEETVAPDTTEDDDPNAQYSLEEIYQFIKKRMAEDAAAEDSDEVVEETEEEETSDDGEEVEGQDLINSLTGSADEQTKDECEEEDEVVTDHAPRIPVTVRDNAVKGGLSALFELAKRG